MKYLCLLLVHLFAWSAVHAAAADVEVEGKVEARAEYSVNQKKEFTFEVTLENKGTEPVYLPSVKEGECEVKVELWTLSKGVLLYTKPDADWRRAQAFVDMQWVKVGPGEKKTVVIRSTELLPADPADDDFARSILEQMKRVNAGRAEIYLRYRRSEGPDTPIQATRVSVRFRAGKALEAAD
ncbi:MAG: hypothetical protein EOP88_05535 [Verrucomicrobiaceae bacterium]|nr:MAG: hypothetical protein EOP88_05535 [Verrucomicrobiaceae bacterium]